MIKHVVTWKLKARDQEGKQSAFTAIAEALGALPAVIHEIKSFHIGLDLAETEGNWDAVLITDFASTADLATYQAHPDHVKASAIVRANTAEKAAVDYEF